MEWNRRKASWITYSMTSWCLVCVCQSQFSAFKALVKWSGSVRAFKFCAIMQFHTHPKCSRQYSFKCSIGYPMPHSPILISLLESSGQMICGLSGVLPSSLSSLSLHSCCNSSSKKIISCTANYCKSFVSWCLFPNSFYRLHTSLCPASHHSVSASSLAVGWGCDDYCSSLTLKTPHSSANYSANHLQIWHKLDKAPTWKISYTVR